jgi:hypothetical protein
VIWVLNSFQMICNNEICMNLKNSCTNFSFEYIRQNSIFFQFKVHKWTKLNLIYINLSETWFAQFIFAQNLFDLSKLHVRPLFLPTREYFVGGVRGFAFQQSKLLIPEICQMREEGLSVHWILKLKKKKKKKSKMKRVKNLPLDLVLIVEVLNHTC